MFMIPKELGIAIIIAAVIVAFIYGKMILIWRDVMLKNNEKVLQDLKRINKKRTVKDYLTVQLRTKY